MLKYVNPDFQISDFKTGKSIIVARNGKTEATFKKLNLENNSMYLTP